MSSIGDDEYRAETVIAATGANARQLGIESELALQGRGVSYCAVCDAAFFRERNVVVVGGGDSAMEEATFLTKFATKVTVVHRRDEFRASPIMLDRARENEKIEILTPYVVDTVLGEEVGKVTGVVLRHVDTGEAKELPADGLFVAIGHDPLTELFLDWLDHDEAGYLVAKPGSTETNIAGVFAAGDVQDHVYRQAVTAAGSGCMAALDAERFLTEQAHARSAVAERASTLTADPPVEQSAQNWQHLSAWSRSARRLSQRRPRTRRAAERRRTTADVELVDGAPSRTPTVGMRRAARRGAARCAVHRRRHGSRVLRRSP